MIESEVLKDFQKLSLMVEEKQQKIVDLEAKLEKKEFAINNYWKSEKNKKEMFREENKRLKQQLAESENENKKIMDLYWNEIAGYEAEVKELKQQLAEKDAEVQSWKDGTMVVKLGKLEQQLAEKEKRTAIRTIEILKSVSSKTYENASDGSEHIIAWLFTPMDVKETLEYINREKFEFKTENQTAIAELEKVKELARKRIEQLNSMEDKTISVIATGLACVWFIDQIDQQINNLRR